MTPGKPFAAATLLIFAVTCAPAQDVLPGLSSSAAAFTRTVIVSPAGDDTRRNCKDLQQALIQITDNDAARPYLIKLEPGVYECTDPHIPMKPYVDIEGSGRGVTTVVGSNAGDPAKPAALFKMASNTELRGLTVINNAKVAQGHALAVLAEGVEAARISDVTAEVSVPGGGDTAQAIRFAAGGALEIDTVRAFVEGTAGNGCGIAAAATLAQPGVLHLSNVVAEAGGDAGRRIGLCAQAPSELALQVHVRDSVLIGPVRSVEEAGGRVTIAHSQLIGPVAGPATTEPFLVKRHETEDNIERWMLKPAVAGLADGGFAVAWMNAGSIGGDWYARVRAQRYDADGNALGTEIAVTDEFLLESLNPASHTRPLAAAGLADGGFVVMWTGLGDGGRTQIVGEGVDRLGARRNLDIVIAQGRSDDYPAVAGLADGGFVAAWCSHWTHPEAGPVNEIVAQRFDADGAGTGGRIAVAETVWINPGETNDAYKVWEQHCNPSVASVVDGDFVVAWQTIGHMLQPDNDDAIVRGRRFNRTGPGVFDPETVFTVPAKQEDYQVRASVAGLADAGHAVSWATAYYWWDGYGGNPPGGLQDFDIASRMFPPDDPPGFGRPPGPEQLVNQGSEFGAVAGTHMQRLNASTGLREGGYVVTWAADHDGRLERRLYGADGVVLGDPQTISDTAAPIPSGHGAPSTDALAQGGHAVAWSYNNDVWAWASTGGAGPKCVYVYDEAYDPLDETCQPIAVMTAGGP